MVSKRVLKKALKNTYRALEGDESVPHLYNSYEYNKKWDLDDSHMKFDRKQKTNIKGYSLKPTLTGSTDYKDPDFPDFEDTLNPVYMDNEGAYRIMRKQKTNRTRKVRCRKR